MQESTVPASGDRGPTPEQLEAIGRYTRRALEPEEVYVFSLLLCDNEVDRDLERFDDGALETLGGLFVGKTGVFDHSAKAEHQSARIFQAAVETPGASNSLGMPLKTLKAWAYMARCDKNADLILEIEAGIKKEVSVGCAVNRILCSVCGADQKEAPCSHKKGVAYEGSLCHHILTEPTDAYEWSFVAVPAQKNAGVTKVHGPRGETPGGEPADPALEKLFGGGKVTLTAKETRELAARYKRLERLALWGGAYEEELRRKVTRLLLLSHPALDPAVAEETAARMEPGHLRAMAKALAPAAGKRYPMPQLAAAEEAPPPGDSPFRMP